MSFTFTNARPLTQEETSPFGNLMGNALKKYMALNNAQYQKREKEADIFSKEMAPLAAIAANPNMRALYPQTQNGINNLVSQYIAGKTGQNQPQSNEQTSNNPLDAQNVYKRLAEHSKETLGEGRRGETTRNKLSGIALQLGFTDVAKKLGNSAKAGNAEAFDRDKLDFEQLLLLQGRTPEQAKQIAKQGVGETPEQYIQRRKPYLFPGGNAPDEEANSNEVPDDAQPEGAMISVTDGKGRTKMKPASEASLWRERGFTVE